MNDEGDGFDGSCCDEGNGDGEGEHNGSGACEGSEGDGDGERDRGRAAGEDGGVGDKSSSLKFNLEGDKTIGEIK